ncbi:MAG: hypothetical protein ACRDQZ_23345 [Mycobacteriales bacterium]
MARDDRDGSRRDTPAPPLPFNPGAIFATLTRPRVEFVVIGAYAAVAQGWSEPTGDIDITPNRDVENLRRLAEALLEMDATVLTDDGELDESWPIDDQHLRLRETTFLTTRYGDVDIVINPAGAKGYPDLARPSESFVFVLGGTAVRVANLDRVIKSKRATDRPKDRDALPRLEQLMRARRREA